VGNRVFRHFPVRWRFARPGADGGGGYPPAGPAHGGEGDPHFDRKKGGGWGGTPLPPLSANGSFSAGFKPLFRGEVILPGKVGNGRVRFDYEEGG